MTNIVLLLTVLSTNWMPMNIPAPNGDGTVRQQEKEVGIVLSNRYARVIADGTTNQILVSSEAVLPGTLLVRDKPLPNYGLTNIWVTNFATWK